MADAIVDELGIVVSALQYAKILDNANGYIQDLVISRFDHWNIL